MTGDTYARGPSSRAPTGLVAGLVAGALLLGGCTSGGAPSEAGRGGSGGPPPTGRAPAPAADDPALDAALSTPVEDRVYPRVGDPGVDALHYDLDLTWDPEARSLDVVETVALRATADARLLRLDLGHPLDVAAVTVDGQPAAYAHVGKDLVVREPVSADSRHTLVVRYAGSPRAVAAPTTRSDFDELGWTTTDEGETWTQQEPYGAYSWYAVNDQPSDKALYSFTIRAPAPLVGVANGELVARRTVDGTTVTRWELDRPASSYLVTLAIGDLEETRDESASGVPIGYWTPRDDPSWKRPLRRTPAGLAWLERRLGPYPFASLGILLVDSTSGMETQTMITLGRTRYATSPEVLVHEMAHQWYGDLVSPTDWRDLWLNEGMALYLQAVYRCSRSGEDLDDLMDEWARSEPAMRREAGPPADYDPATFGEGNVYYGPALMWHELRRRIGERAFWGFVRAWPQAHADGNASREDLVAFVEHRTGRELSAFFDAWLLGRTSPPRLP
jgi:aminopeptidase N